MELSAYSFEFYSGIIQTRAFSRDAAKILAQAEAIQRGWDYRVLNRDKDGNLISIECSIDIPIPISLFNPTVNTLEERDRLIDLLNYKLKCEFAYVPIKSVINIADYLLTKGVKVAQSKDE